MDKKEYFARVFQGQVNSLERTVNDSKRRVDDLETRLKQEKMNLEGDLKLLDYAKKELAKYPVEPIMYGDSYDEFDDEEGRF